MLAESLEVWGDWAFDLPHQRASELRSRFHRLAHAVLRGDHVEVLPFVRHHRQQEQAFVHHHLNDLRDLTWSLIRSLAQIVREDDTTDQAIRQQVEKVHHQVSRASAPDVQSLSEMLQSLKHLLEERERRHREHFQHLQSQVAHLVRELEQARKETTLDPLTGLYNRKAFEQHLQSTKELHTLFGYPATLILVDIDHFKQVNDTWGHRVGDEVLKGVAESLVRVCKRKGDFVARYGGEEFAIILRDTRLHEAVALTQKLIRHVAHQPFSLPDGQTLTITLSAGVSELQPNESPSEWFERTDRLLYQAKHAGRNQLAA